MDGNDAVAAVRGQLEHVPMNEWEGMGRHILESNGLFLNEYELAYKIMVRNVELVNDDEYWGSLTADLFFLVVNLVRLAERDMKRYDAYAELMLTTLEAVGDENGAR